MLFVGVPNHGFQAGAVDSAANWLWVNTNGAILG